MHSNAVRYFDSHSHAHFNAFKNDSDEVIKRSLDAGVDMMLVGTQITTSENAVKTAEQYDGVWAAIGLHPTHTTAGYFDPKEETEDKAPGGGFQRREEKYDPEKYRQLAQSSKKVVAIGEVGLDYYRLEGSETEQEKTKQIQQQVFQQQIDLAIELDLPLAIHCREAHDDVYRMLHEAQQQHKNVRGVIHCFTGTVQEAERYLTLGFMISFSGIVTFASEWDEFIKKMPIESLLIETDCPYLTPMPHRGKRNEPAYVQYTATHLAALRGIETSLLAKQTYINAKNLFSL